MPFNRRAPSPNLPESAFPSSLDSNSSSPPRALLAAFAWDADLRRAGIELIRRLSKPKGPRHRHTRSVDPPRLGGLERIGATQPKVVLHILILAGKTATPDEDEAEARSILLRLFREEGASVQIHTLLHTSHRLSVAVTTSTVRTSLRRAFEEGTTLHEAIKGGLDAAGFVFGEEEAEGNEGSKGFLEELAVILKSASPDKRTTPSITLYLQQRPTEGDFDFDLSEVRAEKIAREAADVFTTSLDRSAPTSSSLFPPTTRNERPKSFELPRGLRLNVPSGPSDPNTRRHSFVPPSQSMLDSTSSSFRPLLLRPAPGPGAQSVSLRLAIHDAQDVVLRVTEASTPLSPTRTIPACRRPLNSTAVAEEPTATTSAPPSPTPTPSTIPIPILSRGRSRSPNSQLPRLTIPGSPAPKSPALPSSFSPDSSEGSSSPDTPPVEPETASTPFNRLLFSPICKLPSSAKPDGEGEGQDSPASAVDSPRWMDVKGLLKKRVDQGDARKKREQAEASGVLFEAPKDSEA
ncbi:hypothetical protein BCR35DRAFT_306828 [Leucosporidium creatinivorum]|uniref:Uncharacterized protein n=1 Tax=Leucosporidium creatinivorum TaxID=106004 RepID=A0A1Y2ER84_9BASI|nr:hypothetical protein BCR35DRAFT_306828 [Leucosporidium creatinivorum]